MKGKRRGRAEGEKRRNGKKEREGGWKAREGEG